MEHLDCITVFTVFSCKANLANTQVFPVGKSHETFSIVHARITGAKILKRKNDFRWGKLTNSLVSSSNVSSLKCRLRYTLLIRTEVTGSGETYIGIPISNWLVLNCKPYILSQT